MNARFDRAWRKRLQLGFLLILFVLGWWGFTTISHRSGAVPPTVVQTSERTSDPTTLEREARFLYESGQFQGSARGFQAAAEAFAARGDALGQAGSYTYQGMALYELGQFIEARQAVEASWQVLADVPPSERRAVEAQAAIALGRVRLALGDAQSALEIWQDAAVRYAELGDPLGELGALTNQAIALQALGLYRRSQTLLETVTERLNDRPDDRLKVAALTDLGVALQVIGDLQESRIVLERTLEISRGLEAIPEQSVVLQALGQTTQALGDLEAADEFYQQAAQQATNPTVASIVQLNRARTAIDREDWPTAIDLLATVEGRLLSLPPSRDAVYATVNFVETRLQLEPHAAANLSVLADFLAVAIERSRTLQDPRAEAYALGELGHLYERQQQWTNALDLTQLALETVSSLNTPDITAQWQAQLGRLYQQLGEFDNATTAYTEAVKQLQALSHDLVTINPEVRLSFRDSVEPIYRDLVSLLLADDPTQAELQQARQTIEALQLAELENFFREACLEARPTQIDGIDPHAAAIYPIVLSDRLEVILSMPGEPLRSYRTAIPETQLEEKLSRMRQALSLSFPKDQRLALYTQLYDWLLRPAEPYLQQSAVETLVFVLDGSLRNLPMSVLYDGERYALERYRLALTPGLQLLESRPLDNRRLQAVIGGLSEGRQGFAALPEVQSEVRRIADEIPAQIQLDREFTTESTREALSRTSSPVLHLATHGQFSSDANETFIVTWDGKLPVSELGTFLKRRDERRSGALELLVLSACQTARGDDRAVLGLAGLAVESGARSTIATLWAVRDRSTANLMVEFYRQLAIPGTTKAEALRQAQLSLLVQSDYEHPFFWAPFVLVGNWM
ncbi:MAG: CHAT domain-containing protein [Cyanobacteria bacterium SBC]|nr:CHAT domain-containing protein [Cyanobacteria bacterium SBC]